MNLLPEKLFWHGVMTDRCCWCRLLGLTSSVEKLDPELYTAASRRGSVLSGKLVTKKESMKEPVPACMRRRKSSLAPRNQATIPTISRACA